MTTRHAKVIIIGRPRRLYRRHLRRARHAEAAPHRGHPARRSDDHHHRCRELSGFADVIQGPWLMDQMRVQAEHVGTEILADHIPKPSI